MLVSLTAFQDGHPVLMSFRCSHVVCGAVLRRYALCLCRVFLELKDGQCGYLALEDNPKAALAPGPSGRLPRTLFGVGAPVVAPLASAGDFEAEVET